MRIGTFAAALVVGLLVLTGGCTTDQKADKGDGQPAGQTSETAAMKETPPAMTQETAPATTQETAPPAVATPEPPAEVAAVETKPEAPAAAPDQQAADGNILIMQLKSGTVRIRLRPDLAPAHVERLKTLTQRGFYDGVVFHRVIAGFMAQTGDPTGTGTGGSELPDLKAEFSDTPFTRGVIGMARTQDPDSANSQFFITYADAPFLNGQYTVLGEVIDGMDAVDAIKKGSEADNGVVTDPDKIISMKLAPGAG